MMHQLITAQALAQTLRHLAAIEGHIAKGRKISIDWPQGGTTSLKYKAQRECRVFNISHILLMENSLRHLGTDKGANLCLKCTKIRSSSSSARTRPGELLRSQPLSRNRENSTSKGRDISSDWPQDGTTLLKYKAQRDQISQ